MDKWEGIRCHWLTLLLIQYDVNLSYQLINPSLKQNSYGMMQLKERGEMTWQGIAQYLSYLQGSMNQYGNKKTYLLGFWTGHAQTSLLS